MGFGGNVGEGVREFFCSFTFKLEGEIGGLANVVLVSGLTGLTGATTSCFLSDSDIRLVVVGVDSLELPGVPGSLILSSSKIKDKKFKNVYTVDELDSYKLPFCKFYMYI